MIDGSAEEDSANPNKLSMFSELGRVAVGEVKTIERTDGFYNPAAWMDDDDITYLLGRYVEMIPDPQTPDEDTSSEMPVIGGGPDTTGLIKLMALGRDGQIVDELTRVLWESKPGEPSFEDFRVFKDPEDPDGKLNFGLTYVEPDGTPYPAVMITTTEELRNGRPEPHVIRVLDDGQRISGDQTTPLNEEGTRVPGKNGTWIDQHSYMYRPNDRLHQFEVLKVEGDSVTHQQYIELPEDISWGKWAMGTCMSPEWTDNTHQESFMLIHGITVVNREFVYSVAPARLFRKKSGELAIDNIADVPLLTSASSDRVKKVVQRHKGRDAFYTVGWVPHRDEAGDLVQVDVYVSPGDSRVDEVIVDPRGIIENWKRPETAIAA